MKKIITASAIALGMFLSAIAPAHAQSRAELQMAATLQIVQEQMQQLALKQAELGEAIKALNARLDASDETTATRFANQAQIVKNVATEVSAIRQGTQDTVTSVGLLKDEIEAMRQSLTSLPALLTQYAAPPPVIDPNDPNAVADPGAAGVLPADPSQAAAVPPAPLPLPPASTIGLSPTRMYQAALSDYQSGRYSVAISGFESFLRQFPQTQLSDDAYVYMGESYFLENKYDQAISAYTQAIQNFPTGDQIPLAYYKRGLAQAQLKQYAEARASWEQLISQHPNSTEAILAKAGLERINRETAASPQ